MANEFAAELSITGSVSLRDVGLTAWTPAGQLDIGTGWPTIDITLEDGTADSQANELYVDYQTINAAASFAVNLFGTLTNFRGQTVNLTKLKGILVVLESPDGIKKFTIGPDGGATPLQAWFSGTAAGNKTEHYHFCFESHQWGGWTVTAGNDCLYINNPGASAINVYIAAWGLK